MVVYDARYNTKYWLTTNYIANNVHLDDGVTHAVNHITFSDAPYPLRRVFFDPKNNDVVIAVAPATSTPLIQADKSIYGYEEEVPITIYTVDKDGLTGVNVRQKAEAELRRVAENYPIGTGSLRELTKTRAKETVYAGWTLYSAEYTLRYTRDLT